MIFFLVSASVPIDMGLLHWLVARRAGACSPGHCGSAAVARQPQEIISGPASTPKRRAPRRRAGGGHHAAPASVVRGPCQTAGGASLRAACSVVVWLPSG